MHLTISSMDILNKHNLDHYVFLMIVRLLATLSHIKVVIKFVLCYSIVSACFIVNNLKVISSNIHGVKNSSNTND